MASMQSTVSVSYVAALLGATDIEPGLALQLMRDVGISSSPRARVTEQQFTALYRSAVVMLDDEMLHLFSRPVWPGALKYTCLGMLDAKNLMVALHRWSYMSRLAQDNFFLRSIVKDGTACICLLPMTEGAPYRPFAIDLMLKLVHGVASWLTRQRLPLIRVDLPFEQPPFAADYEVLYPGPVFFNQPVPALTLDPALLQLPVRRPRSELDDFLREAPGSWLFASSHRPRLCLRLREHLATRLPLQETAETAADALAVSVRTLHRRLTDEGTSFQSVKDEVRRDRAVQLLTQSETSIGLISEQLGFDSVASFHRAFRRWTGSTPNTFRSDGVRAGAG